MTWATSPVYGSVILGPAQSDVYAAVLELTAHGRRPYVTLGRLATITGRPWTSVASALKRLRALELIGVAATMGRRGGHRLWRPTLRRTARQPIGRRTLDVGRHRRAVARVLGILRASGGRPNDRARAGTPAPIWDDLPADHRPARPPAIPPADGPAPADGPSFRERMRNAGFRAWWDTEADGGTPDRAG